jgi:D-glycero-D-manno-heptose 1,7-bisphosphate phosphatase
MKLVDIDVSEYETLFLDRDGVINQLHPHDYIKKWEEFEFLPGVFDAFAKWNACMKHIIIVTNQRGIGKGVMSEDELISIHHKMIKEIRDSGGRVDAIYYCTALSNLDPNRKPNTGMGIQAKNDFPDINFSKSLMIGDSQSDMDFAKNMGMKYKLI